MEIKQLLDVTTYQEHTYLPVIKITTQIICPQCNEPAHLYLLTCHNAIEVKIDCHYCNHRDITRTYVTPKDHTLLSKRQWIKKYLKQYAFLYPEEVEPIIKTLEKNLTKKEE